MISDGVGEGLDDSEGDARKGLSRNKRLTPISDLWSELCISGETGATDRATLDEKEREVMDALSKIPPDFGLAESLTAEAFLLFTGLI